MVARTQSSQLAISSGSMTATNMGGNGGRLITRRGDGRHRKKVRGPAILILGTCG